MTRRAALARAASAGAALLLLLLALAWWPGEARAHASLLSSSPADGSALRAAPTEVTLRFDEAVRPVLVRLVGPGGVEVAPAGPPAVEGGVLRASYPRDLPPGVYLLSYRVISADSHPVAGTVAFGIGAAGTTVRAAGAAGTSMAASIWAVPSEVTRWVFYVAVVTTAGAAVFRRWVTDVPPRLRQMLQSVALAGVLAAALQVGLRGAMLADAPVSGLLDPDTWRLGAGTTLAWSVLVSGAGLLGCAVALGQAGQGWRWSGLASALVVLAGFPLSGHAASTELGWIATLALVVHMLAVVYWLGSFWPLIEVLRGSAKMVAAVKRFSRIAIPAVTLLMASGSALAFVQAGRGAALVESRYGWLVAGKLALFLPLVALAAWNRLMLTPMLNAGAPEAPRRLRRAIRVESAIAGAILAVTSVLALTPPPRQAMQPDPAAASGNAAAAAPHPQEGHVHRSGGLARLVARERGVRMLATVTPAQMGPNRIRAVFDRADGELPTPKEVWLDMSQPEAGIAPIRRPMELEENGVWFYQGPELAIPGRWTLGFEVLLTEFEQLNLRAQVVVR